jgi:cytochrome b561
VTTSTSAPAVAVHPDSQYSRGAKWFHWLTVPPMAIILLSGLTIRFMNDDVKMSFYSLHESLGMLMLLLTVARVAWRLRNPPPPMAAHIPALERMGAGAVHNAFYVLLVAQPLLGFFTTNAYGFPQRGATAFLGVVDLPKFMEASQELARALHWTHSIVGWLLVPMIAAHVSGVLYHHVAKKDGTLMRML